MPALRIVFSHFSLFSCLSSQVKGGEIPSKLPPNLVPPSMQQSAAAKTTTAPAQSLPSLQTSSSSISTTPIVSPAKGTFVTSTGTPVTGTGTPVTNTGTPITSTGTPVTGTSLSPAVSVGMDGMDGFSAIKQLDTLSTELENLTRLAHLYAHRVQYCYYSITVEPLLKDSPNKRYHINYLPTNDTFQGTKNRPSYSDDTFSTSEEWTTSLQWTN